jgi:hypothetical protein
MSLRTTFKTGALTAFFLLLALGVLAACGASTATTSTASTGTTTTTAARTPGAANRLRPVTGTVSQYHATTKSLTMKLTNGSTQTFQIAANARIIQDQKITQQQLSTLLSKSGIVVFAIGQKASNGAYTAQEIIASTTMSGNNGPQGRGSQATPRTAGNRLFLQNSKLQNNQLVGDDMSGHAITVKLSGNTTLLGQTEATASDLQAGQMITVITGSAQNSNSKGITQIVIGPLPGTAA